MVHTVIITCTDSPTASCVHLVSVRAPVTAAAGAVVRFRISKRMLVTVLQQHRCVNVLYNLYTLPLQQLHTNGGVQSQYID
jgi:hypothetical protein